MEPVSLVLAGAALGGVTSKAAEIFTGYLSDLLRGQDRAAQEQGAANVAAFLQQLSTQIERLEHLRPPASVPVVLEEALSDPDMATTIRASIVGAARTSSEEKHGVLARAVAERLCSPADSVEAVSANLAVEVVPKLAIQHLHLLGLCAIVYVIRPPLATAFGSLPQSEVEPKPGWRIATKYVEWLSRSLAANSLQQTLAELQFTHLAATSCLVYERKARRNLTQALLPGDAGLLDRAAVWAITADLELFLQHDPLGRELRQVWSAGLQHATLTPTGALIATAVSEVRSGEVQRVPWNAALNGTQSEIEDAVWDGGIIREEFLKELDRQIESRADRGVGIWRNLDR